MLVVVHPGTACRTAETDLGLFAGATARERLARTIFRWRGDILVLDNPAELEIRRSAELSLAIVNATEDKKAPRIHANPATPGWNIETAGAIARLAQGRPVHLTGAWRNRAGADGSIDILHRTLRDSHGIDCEVLPCSLTR